MTLGRAPVVIVSGGVRCGTSLGVAMLEAGGMDIANAGPPFYELDQVKADARLVFADVLRHAADTGSSQHMRWWARPVLWGLRAAARGGRRFSIDAEWFASLDGCAIKVPMPHYVKVPAGSHRALWLDRNEGARAHSLLRHIDIEASPERLEALARYFTAARHAGRAALVESGAQILDLHFEDLVEGATSCRRAVDKIATFLDLPLDRDAMVARAGEYCRQQNDLDRLSDHIPAWNANLWSTLRTMRTSMAALRGVSGAPARGTIGGGYLPARDVAPLSVEAACVDRGGHHAHMADNLAAERASRRIGAIRRAGAVPAGPIVVSGSPPPLSGQLSGPGAVHRDRLAAKT